MKLKKMLLLISFMIGSFSFAADSLQEALSNGKVSGQVRFLYTSGSQSDIPETNPVNNSDTGSIVLELDYITELYKGFEFGVGFQTGHDLEFHDKDGSTEDDSRNTVSDTNLHQLFLKYSFLKSNIKIGRQTIKLPLLMNSGAFPLRDSFDAATVVLNEIPDTMINFAYVKKWNKRYGGDSSGSLVQEDVDYSNPLYSLYIKNKSIDNLVLSGQYLLTNEDDNNGDAPVLVGGGYDEYFVMADYTLPTDFPLVLSATYGGADFDLSTQDDVSFYGFKIGTKISDVKLDFAYTSIGDEHDFPGTLGHVPDALIYTSVLTNNAIFAGVDAYSIQAMYDFGVENLSTRLKYAHFDQSDEGISNSSMDLDDSDEINIDIKYKFSGILEGFSTRLFAGYGTYDENVKDDDFTYGRLYVTYSF